MDNLEIYRKAYKVGLIVEDWYGGPVDSPMVSLEEISKKIFVPRLAEGPFANTDQVNDALHAYLTEVYNYEEARSNLKRIWGIDLKEVVENYDDTDMPWDDVLTEGVRFKIDVHKEVINYDDEHRSLLVKLIDEGDLSLTEGLKLAKLEGIDRTSEFESFISEFLEEHS